MSRFVLFVALLVLAAPPASAWQTDRTRAVISRHTKLMNSHEQQNARDFNREEDRTWRELMAKLPKLRAKLA